MIELIDVCKDYPTRSGASRALDHVNLRVKRGERLAIMGGNGAGKSTLVRIISGIEQPTSGTVNSAMRISWPLAFSGGFQGSLTGLDNMRFICRVYGKDWRECIDFVEDFSQLGRYMQEPLKSYSSGMRARLAFAMSMMIEFDCYLLDEVFLVGDARFQKRCHEELFVKRSDRAFIIVSHDLNFLREHCNVASTLQKGIFTVHSDFAEAEAAHNLAMR
jgi:capsular polysaccharide transport system ATP-binding protein